MISFILQGPVTIFVTFLHSRNVHFSEGSHTLLGKAEVRNETELRCASPRSLQHAAMRPQLTRRCSAPSALSKHACIFDIVKYQTHGTHHLHIQCPGSQLIKRTLRAKTLPIRTKSLNIQMNPDADLLKNLPVWTFCV